MGFSLRGTNIIILAKNHNPSIISKEWLEQKEVVTEKVLNFTHTPVFSLVETENFNLLVDPDRLQILLKNITPENVVHLPIIGSRYVNHLPETPYRAMGLNYLYEVPIQPESLKRILVHNETKFKQIFSEKYHFGEIIFFNFKDFQVKVIIQPILPDHPEKVTADFNFHFDAKNVEDIKGKLVQYLEVKKKAEEILGALFNG